MADLDALARRFDALEPGNLEQALELAEDLMKAGKWDGDIGHVLMRSVSAAGDEAMDEFTVRAAELADKYLG